MTVRDESIDITVDGQIIYGTLFMPAHALGAVLFAHGWAAAGSNTYGARARSLSSAICA